MPQRGQARRAPPAMGADIRQTETRHVARLVLTYLRKAGSSPRFDVFAQFGAEHRFAIFAQMRRRLDLRYMRTWKIQESA